MSESRYKVLINDTVVAENMDIDTATTLVKALFEKYYNDHTMRVSVKEMERAEYYNDR